jgi:hypothetical protein
MKRYNHDGLPMPMIEDKDGYWVTFNDYNNSLLDCNKLVEKAWQANIYNREQQAMINSAQVESLRNIIVMLSFVSFSAFATILFMWV